jgi:catalase
MHMITWVMSPRGIPANYRQMDGFGVNTYRMVNAAGEGVLVKYHWKSQQGIESLTQAQADEIQKTELGSHTKDLIDNINAGNFPKWELNVQIMSDDEHPELDFDPLDDTKIWPEDVFPLRPVGMMTLNENIKNFHNESEQIAFGTGVLVDGLDFSDDKMLVGRTFSYSDTQRYRVGPNYLQLPVNAPLASVRTNQEGGQMSYHMDERGADPGVNYEPSVRAGLSEADASYAQAEFEVPGNKLVRQSIDRTNNYGQARERYLTIEDWERDELVNNIAGGLAQCDQIVVEKFMHHVYATHEEFGQRVQAQIDAIKGAAVAD